MDRLRRRPILAMCAAAQALVLYPGEHEEESCKIKGLGKGHKDLTAFLWAADRHLAFLDKVVND